MEYVLSEHPMIQSNLAIYQCRGLFSSVFIIQIEYMMKLKGPKRMARLSQEAKLLQNNQKMDKEKAPYPKKKSNH